MDGLAATRATRWGGLILGGAALLAAGTLGVEWRHAPAALRLPLVELVLLGAGILLLVGAFLALALGRGEVEPTPQVLTPEPSEPSSSLMTLPAILGDESANQPPGSSSPTVTATPEVTPPSVSTPLAVAATSTASSTLLIPFAETSPSPAPPRTTPPGQTVTRLVGRMDALQRVAPPAPAALSFSSIDRGSPTSSLLHRLTRIPSPPSAPLATPVARRCNDCGDQLGSPPQFEPCSDCGRALCERCYWRTSSGPQAHLCTTCFNERSVPRRPAPAVTFGRPTAVASGSTSVGRALRPRRRVS